MKLDTDKMLAEKDGATGWITFNNPERRNAMSLEMWSGLETALAAFEEDPEVRAIVMKGAGDKAFVSGADISQFAEKRADAEAAAAYARTSESARRKLSSVTKPLIGMIRGFCMGGGLGIAMKADVRIASADSIFGIPAARLSIAYSFDNVRDLVNLVGPSFAKDILFSARRLTADEALRIGLVNRVVPAEELEQTVRDYVGALADNAPLSMRASKATVNEVIRDAADRDMALIEKLGRDCFDSQDYAEGRKAFMEKRRPVFKGA